DDQAIQAAIDFAEAQGGGTVTMGAGTYNGFAKAVQLKSNVMLTGAGQGQTILQDSVHFDDQINSDPNTTLMNAGISNFTIDVGMHPARTGVKVSNFNNFTVSNVTIKNITTDGWGAYFGVDDAANNPDRNDGLTIENLTVENHQNSSLESVLIFNTNNVNGNIHIKDRINGPGVGLWQKVDNATLTVTGENTQTGALLYYSYSTENLNLNVSGTNVHMLVQGGNESDHGLFGYTSIETVKITVSGTGTGTPGAGVQLGGLNGAEVTVGTLTNFEVPILIDDGNAVTHTFPSTNFTITLGTIVDNNPGDDVHALHPGILFVNAAQINGIIKGGTITTSDGTQLFPIAFEGGVATNLIIVNTELKPGTGGQSVQVNASATIGDGVAFVNIPGAVINNTALVSHFITPAALVDYAQQSNIDITNAIPLSGDGDGILALQNPFGTGTTHYDITISNTGTIAADGIAIHASALESAGGQDTSDITITNNAAIAGQHGAVHAISQTGKATITNTGSARATGSGSTAIKTGAGDDTFTNTGTVSGATALDMGAGDDTAALSGTVQGMILLGDGADHLFLNQGLSWGNTADAGAGIDTLTLSTDGSWDIGRFVNFENLKMTTAATLSGDSIFSDQVTFSGDGVVLNGANFTTPQTTVAQNAHVTISKTSAMSGDMENAGKLRLEPGQTLTVGGSFLAQPQSTTVFGLTENAHGKINATQDLTFLAGSVVEIDVQTANQIAGGTEYILGTGATTTFQGDVSDNSALFDVEISTRSSNLIATVQQNRTLSDVTIQSSTNTKTVAATLDTEFANGNLTDLKTAMGQQATDDDVQRVLADAAPDDDFASVTSVENFANTLTQSLFDRATAALQSPAVINFRSQPPTPLGWYQIQNTRIEMDATAENGGADINAVVQSIGLERAVPGYRVTGLSIGWGDSTITGTGTSANVARTVHNKALSYYAGWTIHKTLDAFAAATVGWNTHTDTRTIAALNETATSSYDSHLASMAFGIGQRVHTAVGWDIQTNAILAASHIHVDAYTETGSAANVSYDAFSHIFGEMAVSLHMDRTLSYDDVALTPYVHSKYSRTFGADARTTTAHYARGSSPFSIVSGDIGRNSVDLELGVSATFKNGITISGEIRKSWSNTQDEETAIFQIQRQF
ncbi:MAG: autotransporter domain-containing protein, partial [Pseudomonadota bacterium]